MAAGSGSSSNNLGDNCQADDEENSGFGFGIYYWMINLGAFLAPLLVSILKGFSWSYVFVASSTRTAPSCSCQPSQSSRDPPKPEDTKTLNQVLKGAAMVLGDARFMLMIFVYSDFGSSTSRFWLCIWFLRDFVNTERSTASSGGLGIPFARRCRTRHCPQPPARSSSCRCLSSRIVKNIRPLPRWSRAFLLGSLWICLACLCEQRLDLHHWHRRLFHRRNDRPSEVYKLVGLWHP